MKKNYQAWEVDLNEFSSLTIEKDRLNFFIKFAVLAPSSHNTQPWKFIVKKDSTIEVYRDTSRRLPIADTSDRQLFLSIGCAIENLIISAKFFGYQSDIQYFDANTNNHLC